MRQVTWVVVDDHGDDADASGLPAPDRVVCADSGLMLAQRLGLQVDLVVGDMDSVPAAALGAARDAGSEIETHPVAKAATDLALALARGGEGLTSGDLLVVLGGAGGRLDHALANVHALADPSLAHVQLHARLGWADVHVVRDVAILELPLQATVSLLPSGGAALGITTEGLAYPLTGEDLHPWSTRGVSNIVTGTPVRIGLTDGCLLVVAPLPRKDNA
jgi:thiamine pyrophosphokinase